ncbi:uncharacterized protein [Centruroides vittatus]|uniref:uncharacterized protein n=1 Tax=Centruroides vittatus TaxID=120091 RepID=UPI003510C58A
MEVPEEDLDSSATDCKTTSKPDSPARLTPVEETSATLEAKLLAESKQHLQRIMDLPPQPSKSNPSVPEKKEIKECATSLFATINKLYGSLVELRAARPSLATTQCQCQQMHSKPAPSYSDIVKANIPQSSTTKTISKSINKKIKSEGCSSSYALIVYPKDANDGKATMENIQKSIIKDVKPDKLQIKVTAIKRVKGDGICFRTSSLRDATVLEQAIQGLPEVQLLVQTKLSEGKRPRVILLNVPKSVKDENIISTIYKQNESLHGINKKDFVTSTRFSTALTRGNMKENCRHIVLSTTPYIRSQLIKEKYISMSWVNVLIDDYVHITCCYQCCGFNHQARNCTSKQFCSHCSKAHRYSECTRRDQPSCCITCKTANKDLTRFLTIVSRRLTFQKYRKQHPSN